MKTWIRNLIFGCILCMVKGDNSVHILTNKYIDGTLTSSILKWVSHVQFDANKDFVKGGYETIDSGSAKKEMKRSIYVCRALHNGVWVSGGQKEGDKRCAIAVFGTAAYHENYELLLNVDHAARLVWTEWDKYKAPEIGSVLPHLSPRMFVARCNSSTGSSGKFSYFVGTLNREEGFGKLSFVNELAKEGSSESGQILKEIEPVHYELKSVVMQHQKKRVHVVEPRVLGHAVIRNQENKKAEFDEAFSYLDSIWMYWGQSPAIIKGLNTTIKLQDGTRMPNVSWGIPYQRNETKVYTIKVILEPGTGINVTLRANYTEFDMPYQGKLTSIYEDYGQVDPRKYYGSLQQKGLGDVVADLSPIYYLANQTLVPTTTTTSTTSTTTTSTTTTTTSRPSTAGKGETSYDPDLDENSVSGKGSRKSDSGMQADDGRPQKDKYESSAISHFLTANIVQLAISLTMANLARFMIT